MDVVAADIPCPGDLLSEPVLLFLHTLIWGVIVDVEAADILCPGDSLSLLLLLSFNTLALALLTLARLREIQSFTESRCVTVLAIDFRRRNCCTPVSYTHLTLPTILRV